MVHKLFFDGKRSSNKIANLNKIPHPKGRKAAQLTKKTISLFEFLSRRSLENFEAQAEKPSTELIKVCSNTIKAAGREKVKLLHQMKVNIIGEKILWFKEHLDSVDNYTPQLTINLIERYLGRFNEELEQIKLKQTTGKRKGRQHASREDIINMTINNEKNEFSTCGIEMPDVLNPQQLDLLRNWSGELKYLQNFKLVRYTKGKLENMKCSIKNPKDERKKTLQFAKKEEEAKKVDLMEIS